MAPIASRNFIKHCFLATWIFDIRDLDYFEPAGQTVDNLRRRIPWIPFQTRGRDLLKSAREDPPPILTFGGEVHYCLGANLARRELAEALKILARRLPNPRRIGSPPWKPLLGMSGPTSLPMQFG
jgi:hypothetical protein